MHFWLVRYFKKKKKILIRFYSTNANFGILYKLYLDFLKIAI